MSLRFSRLLQFSLENLVHAHFLRNYLKKVETKSTLKVDQHFWDLSELFKILRKINIFDWVGLFHFETLPIPVK